ncbi:MAG: T9SS C-terminal target domain-containing protein [Cytophagia bacterium]|nr:T9SS C-terminal target domain-containing protein [Cytophagia bacterium]
MDEGQSFSIPLTSLQVKNAPGYPTDYSLLIEPGSHYTVSGNLITPTVQVSDTLYVPIRIASASDISDIYNFPFKINIITSINELLQVGWMIYPNPIDTEIHILNEQYNGIFTVTILDNFGRVVFSSKINSKSESVNHTIDFKSFDPGLYMLFIYDDRMGRMGFKIIKN